MIAVWIIGALVLILILLLLIPVVINIDTESNDYKIVVGHLVSGSFIPDLNDPMLRLEFGWWLWEWHILELLVKRSRKQQESKKSAPANSEKKPSKRSKVSLKLIRRVLKSFKVRRLYIDIDTGDYARNGILYPVFYFLGRRRGNLNINFNGENKVQLNVLIRPVFVIKNLML